MRDEAESGGGGAQPELVVLAAEECFIETANRLEQLAAEHRHDENRVVVLDHVDELDFARLVRPGKHRTPVEYTSAQIPGVSADNRELGLTVEHSEKRHRKGGLPLVIAVEECEVTATSMVQGDVARM